ncbi:hypothetical protein P9112_008674 [Eukaryota sp. TZLM1-RC]
MPPESEWRQLVGQFQDLLSKHNTPKEPTSSLTPSHSLKPKRPVPATTPLLFSEHSPYLSKTSTSTHEPRSYSSERLTKSALIEKEAELDQLVAQFQQHTSPSSHYPNPDSNEPPTITSPASQTSSPLLTLDHLASDIPPDLTNWKEEYDALQVEHDQVVARLEEVSSVAEELESKVNHYQQNEQDHLQTVAQLKTQVGDLTSELDRIKGEVDVKGVALSSVNEVKHSLEQEILQLRSNNEDNLSKKDAEINQLLERINGYEALLQEEKGNNLHQQAEFERNIDYLKEQIVALKVELKSKNRECDKVSRLLTSEEQKLVLARRELADVKETLRKSNEVSGQDAAEKQAEINRLAGELSQSRQENVDTKFTFENQIADLTSQLQVERALVAEEQNKCGLLRLEIGDLQGIIDEKDQALSEKETEYKNKSGVFDGVINALKEEISKFKQRESELVAQNEELNNEIATIKSELNSVKLTSSSREAVLLKEKSDLEMIFSQKNTEIADLTSLIESLKSNHQQELNSLNESITPIKEENIALESRISELSKENVAKSQTLATAKATLSARVFELEQSNNELIYQVKQKDTDLSELTSRFTDTMEHLEEVELNSESLAVEKNRLESDLARVEEQLSQLYADFDKFEAEKTSENSELSNQVEKLKSELEALNNSFGIAEASAESLSEQLSNVTREYHEEMKAKNLKIKDLTDMSDELRREKVDLSTALEEKCQELDAERNEKEEQINSLQLEVEQKQSNLETVSDQLSHEISELKAVIEEKDLDLSELTSSLSMNENLVDELKMQISTLQAQLKSKSESFEEEVAAKAFEVQHLKGIVSELRESSHEISKDKDHLRTELCSKLDDANTEISLLKHKIDVFSSEKEDLELELQRLMEENQNNQYQNTLEIAAITDEKLNLIAELDDCKHKLQEILDSNTSKLTNCQSINEELSQAVEYYKQEVFNSQSVESELSARVSQLEQQLDDVMRRHQDEINQIKDQNLIRVNNLSDTLSQITSERDCLVTKLSASQEQISHLELDLSSIRNSYTECLSYLSSVLPLARNNLEAIEAAGVINIESQLEDCFNSVYNWVTESMDLLAEEASGLLDTSVQIRRDRQELIETREKCNAEISSLNCKILGLKSEIEQYERKTKSLQLKNSTLSEKIELIQININEDKELMNSTMNSQIKSLSDEVSLLKRQKDGLVKQVEILKSQKEEINHDKEQLMTRVEEQQAQVLDLESRHQDEITTKELEVSELNDKIALLEEEKQSIEYQSQQKIGQLNSKILELRQEVESGRSFSESQANSFKESIETYKKRIDDLVGEVTESQQLIKQLRDDNNQSNKQFKTEINQKNEEIRGLLHKLDCSDQSIRQLEMRLLESDSNSDTLSSLSGQYANLNERFAASTKQISQLESECQSYRNRIDELERINEELTSNLCTIPVESAASSTTEILKAELSDTRQSLERARDEIKVLKNQKNELYDQNLSLNQSISKLQTRDSAMCFNLESEVEELRSELNHLNQEKTNLLEKSQSLEQTMRVKEFEIEKLNNIVDEKDSELLSTVERCEYLEQSHSQFVNDTNCQVNQLEESHAFLTESLETDRSILIDDLNRQISELQDIQRLLVDELKEVKSKYSEKDLKIEELNGTIVALESKLNEFSLVSAENNVSGKAENQHSISTNMETFIQNLHKILTQTRDLVGSFVRSSSFEIIDINPQLETFLKELENIMTDLDQIRN